ncbi:hypothetical protein AB4Y32_24165 [Paraburkholderia phymatum]|uniref:Uncharacterized protein n=1 Tax=Paraburkholderia phymatum TaxID=148447 RepID=A0ACC6U596_9BURK
MPFHVFVSCSRSSADRMRPRGRVRRIVDDGPRPTSQWLCHSRGEHARKSAQQGWRRNREIVDMRRMAARNAANDQLSISVGVRMPDGGIGFLNCGDLDGFERVRRQKQIDGHASNSTGDR